MPSVNINTFLKEEAHLSPTRLDRIERKNLAEVSYGDGDAVKEARNAITYMGDLDRVVDWCFDSRKEEALALIADKVLGQLAREWQKKHPLPDGSLPAIAHEVSRASAKDTQAKLEGLISPRGWDAIFLGGIQDTGEGVRFVPDTGSGLADVILTMEYTYLKAQALLKERTLHERRRKLRHSELVALNPRSHNARHARVRKAIGASAVSNRDVHGRHEDRASLAQRMMDQRLAVVGMELTARHLKGEAPRDVGMDSVTTTSSSSSGDSSDDRDWLEKRPIVGPMAVSKAVIAQYFESQARSFPAAANAIYGSPESSDDSFADQKALGEREFQSALARLV